MKSVRNSRGELATILTISTLVILGVMTVISTTMLQSKRVGYKSRAEGGNNTCQFGITNAVIENPPNANNKVFTVKVAVSDDLTGRADRAVIVAIKKNGNWPEASSACTKLPNDAGPNVTTSFTCDINNGYNDSDKLEVVASRMMSDFDTMGISDTVFQKKWYDLKNSTSEPDKEKFTYFMTKCVPEGPNGIWRDARVVATYTYGDFSKGVSTPVPVQTAAPGTTAAPTAPAATAVPTSLETWKFSTECGNDSGCYCRKLNMEWCAPAGGACIQNAWDTKWGCKTKGGGPIVQPTAPVGGTPKPTAEALQTTASLACMDCIFGKYPKLASELVCKLDNEVNKNSCLNINFKNWCAGNPQQQADCLQKKSECSAQCSAPAATPTKAPDKGAAATTPKATATPTTTKGGKCDTDECNNLISIKLKLKNNSSIKKLRAEITLYKILYDNDGQEKDLIECDFSIKNTMSTKFDFTSNSSYVYDNQYTLKTNNNCAKKPEEKLRCSFQLYNMDNNAVGDPLDQIVPLDEWHKPCNLANQSDVNPSAVFDFTIPPQSNGRITGTPSPKPSTIPTATSTPAATQQTVQPTDITNGARKINTHITINSLNRNIPRLDGRIGVLIAHDLPFTTTRLWGSSVAYLVNPVKIEDTIYSEMSLKNMEFNFSNPYDFGSFQYDPRNSYASLHAEYCFKDSSADKVDKCVYDNKWLKNLVWYNFKEGERFDFTIDIAN